MTTEQQILLLRIALEALEAHEAEQARSEAYQNQCELNSNAVDKLRRDKAALLWAISEFQNFPSERAKHALFNLANEVKE